MQKEFAQIVFYSKDSDELLSFATAIHDMKLPSTITVKHQPEGVCLLSSDLESLITLYENFKEEEQFTLEPIVYFAPTQEMAHGGLAVEAGDVVTGFDLWLGISPTDVFDNTIEHNHPVSYDTDLIDQQLRKLFNTSEAIGGPICRTKVKVLAFDQDGEPSRESLVSALRGALEGAFTKASPVEVTARLSITLAVVERQFDSAKALFDSLGGEVTAIDLTGRLKKVIGVLPVGTVLEQYGRFVNITKEGDLGVELKDFVPVSK